MESISIPVSESCITGMSGGFFIHCIKPNLIQYNFAVYCYGEGFVKVLMQDYGLLHGVIAFVRTHYHA